MLYRLPGIKDIHPYGGLDLGCCSVESQIIGFLIGVLDAIVYIWCPVIIARSLRVMEGRDVLHRLGKRTIIIADTQWVAYCLEQFVTKLFALSYSFSAPEVHCGEPVDDLIHRFGHRVARGTILALGRPDGRLFGLTKTESAVLLGAKQLTFVENYGVCPEVGRWWYDEDVSICVDLAPCHRFRVACTCLLRS